MVRHICKRATIYAKYYIFPFGIPNKKHGYNNYNFINIKHFFDLFESNIMDTYANLALNNIIFSFFSILMFFLIKFVLQSPLYFSYLQKKQTMITSNTCNLMDIFGYIICMLCYHILYNIFFHFGIIHIPTQPHNPYFCISKDLDPFRSIFYSFNL